MMLVLSRAKWITVFGAGCSIDLQFSIWIWVNNGNMRRDGFVREYITLVQLLCLVSILGRKGRKWNITNVFITCCFRLFCTPRGGDATCPGDEVACISCRAILKSPLSWQQWSPRCKKAKYSILCKLAEMRLRARVDSALTQFYLSQSWFDSLLGLSWVRVDSVYPTDE